MTPGTDGSAVGRIACCRLSTRWCSCLQLADDRGGVLLAGRDVDRDTDRAGGCAVGVDRDPAPALDPVDGAVGPDAAVEEDIGARIRQRAFDPPETFGPVVGVQRGDPVLERPPESAGRQAVQRLEAGVPDRGGGRHVPGPRPKLGGLQREHEPLFGDRRHNRCPLVVDCRTLSGPARVARRRRSRRRCDPPGQSTRHGTADGGRGGRRPERAPRTAARGGLPTIPSEAAPGVGTGIWLQTSLL